LRGCWRQLLLVVPLALLAASAGAADYVIVAHSGVEGSKISRSVLAGIYQKDVIRWGDQTRIRPVDQSGQTPIRQAFARDILGRSLGETQSYWASRMAIHREMPPPSKASDEEVLAYVASKKGAIGYVTSEMELPEDIKVLALVD
jgi:ABC-type phosphate transport system substrate-binding protein